MEKQLQDRGPAAPRDEPRRETASDAASDTRDKAGQPAEAAKPRLVQGGAAEAPAPETAPQTAPETAPAPKPGKPGKPKPAGGKPKPAAGTPEAPAPRPMARPARMRRRHWVLLLSFLLGVLAPVGGAGLYLWGVAEDQYASRVGFSVRKEEMSSPVELLGGITELSGSSSNDTDILFEIIKSQSMVRLIDARLDLRAIYANPDDPVFGLDPAVRIEGLTEYWNRVVDVFYDGGTGLIEIQVRAFDPESAQAIAAAIFDESSRMINELSAIARDDSTRYAREELDRAVQRLKEARAATTAFRTRTQIVDPVADIQGRMGLVNTLQAQLAEALIELDLIRSNSRGDDPRVEQAQRRVEVVEERLTAERNRFSESESSGDTAYSSLVSEYEALAVDQEFAEKAYLSALATYDSALAEAQRQSRYLASYIAPTLAETAEYPRRLTILGVLAAILAIGWSILAMIYYSLRDRR